MNDNVVASAGTVTDATHQPNPNEVAQPNAQPDPSSAESAEAARPDWLPEKFKTPEDMATSYKELEQKFMTKTEDLKTSLLDEIKTTQKEGVPDEASGYEVPSGFNPEETVDTDLWKTFTEWSHERQLGQDDFNELVNFYASALTPDLEVERGKLGDNAQERLDNLSRWVGANVPENMRDRVINFAQTAEAVEVMETLMKLTVPQKLPGQTEEIANEPLDESKIQTMMSSPAYLDPAQRDPAVVKQVDEWFAAKYNNVG